MAKAKRKTGKTSHQEWEILAACRDMPTAEIAKKLNRTEAFVRTNLAKLPEIERNAESNEWIARLHTSSFWVDVRKGLIGSEVNYFERAWASYMDQFGSSSDILPTDELMIKDLVMLDVVSQRAINEQASILRRIEQLEKQINDESSKTLDDRNDLNLSNWRTQLNALYAAKGAISKQHLEYQQRKDAKLRDLKGSRDQRFKQIEESRRNIFELIKELDKHHRRMREGRLAEKMKIAAENVKDDWNEVMTYEDGTLDKPFLSPEGELSDDRLQNEQKTTSKPKQTNSNELQRKEQTKTKTTD